MKINDILVEFVTPQAVAQDPGLEREKDVDVIFFGKMPRDYAAETAWAALEEVLPAEYPADSEKAQEKVKEVAFQGGAVVTTKPLSVAKKLVATFTGYGIKSRINGNLNEFAPSGDGGGSGDYFQALASAWYNGTFDTGSLQKGIKSQQDVERLLNRGIVCPDGKTRKLHIDYNSDFDGVEIYSDDYYEYGDHDDTIDSRTGQKWGPYDFMAFSDEDLSEGLTEFAADDGDSGGEDDALRNYARMWWAGDEATQMQIERALAKMGWEIGEDEGGYDNGGVFVVRAGDINGDSYTSWAAEDLTEGVAVGDLNEKSTSQAQFRTMAAAAHDPKFAKKVGIKQRVAREFNKADKGQDYKDLPKKATEGATVTTTPGSIDPGGAVDNFKQQMANNTERDMAEGNRKPEPPEADYGDDYQDMVKRVKKLAGLGPLKTQYDPNKRVYRNMPTAVQPRK